LVRKALYARSSEFARHLKRGQKKNFNTVKNWNIEVAGKGEINVKMERNWLGHEGHPLSAI